MGIISVAVRSGICIYAVKYTMDEGVWGSAEKAIAFKKKTCEAVNENHYVQTGKAHFSSHVPLPELPELPSTSEVGFITTYYYNKSVKASIWFVKMLPCYVGQLIKKASDSVKKALEQPPQAQA